ncbi:MAG TPA: class I SAM-dependent methyltransferase [Solirubrobacteraceae bacterium]|nr:class I SAM-dependent methyltransferase [Solirubrobacteraceae bacterium]
MDEYLAVNRGWWDSRAAAHARSPDYATDRFVADPQFLSRVVRFDRPRLGVIRGLRGVHLQCHIGTDTLSLARLGARMTGLDSSPASVEQARLLAARAGAPVEFVEAEVYDAPEVLGCGGFDLVYTGIGALCWLPSVARWATVVAALLAPGGRLFIREGHPMLWTLDHRGSDGVLAVEHPYFERAEPSADEFPGTYVRTDATFEQNLSYDWNHGLGEIIGALLDSGMQITELTEHDSVPWEAFPGGMERTEGGEWRLSDRPWRVPHSYTLQAVRR